MSQLPIIPVSYSHKMTMPDGVDVNFRPFTGKEEKVLLLAVESNNELDLAKAVLDVATNCIEGDYPLGTKPVCYTEFTLVNMRAKSVGEDQEMRVLCENCEEPNELTVNLEDVQVTRGPRSGKDLDVTVTDGIDLVLRELTMQDVLSRPKLINTDKEAGLYYELVDLIIDSVVTPESVVKLADSSKADRDQFIESLPATVHNELRSFVEGSPSTYLDVKFACKKCGHDNQRKLQGLENFFGS